MSISVETEAFASRSEGMPPPAALLFELEGVAYPVRSALFEIASAYLNSKNVKLSAAHFARCVGPMASIATQLHQLLSLDGDGTDLAAALNDGLVQQFSSGQIQLSPGLDRVLKAAAQRHVPAAAVTGLPEAVAHAAYAASGFEARGITLFVFGDDEKPFPRADAWLKAVKQLGKVPRFCVAFGSSQAASKSALSAGLRTVSVPDAYTSHHDFGGSDLILDSWDDISAKELLEALIPPLR